VLANRLSAAPSVHVALLEAGPGDKNFLIHMPMGYAALMKTGWVDWGYHTEPQAGMGGRRLYWIEFGQRHDLHSRRSERL
jgi:choline dehydrogenase-like flavoprotein